MIKRYGDYNSRRRRMSESRINNRHRRMYEDVDTHGLADILNSGSVKLIKVVFAEEIVAGGTGNSRYNLMDCVKKSYDNIQDLLYDIQQNTDFSGNIEDYTVNRNKPNVIETIYRGMGTVHCLQITIEVLKYVEPDVTDMQSLGLTIR